MVYRRNSGGVIVIMCGINGLLQFNNNLNASQLSELIDRMNEKITHRGPDDEGKFISENIGLGMRRLSIIDLNTGKQPIFNEDGTKVIVFNGEIYNYKVLREELIKKNHVFRTMSDTEVIIHLYEEYGKKSFEKLIGMFSIAIYDITKKSLILVRDRVGEKPLYYTKSQKAFVFSSELKGILTTNYVNKAINSNALNQYLQLTYIPAPLTILEGVYKLQAGYYLEIDSSKNFETKQYWDVSYSNIDMISNFKECKEELRSTVFKAVKECMVSDVPVGAFLSGGIDSTIIVGIMSRISEHPISTFTIGYKQKDYDESNRAQLVADHYKTDHHVYFLESEDIMESINDLLNNVDEPFADSSLIPTYIVSKFAQKKVKVILTGDAGDELFGGYNKYLMGYYSQRYNYIPKWGRKIIKCIVTWFPDNTTLMHKARKLIDNSKFDPFTQNKNLMSLGFKQVELSQLLVKKYFIQDSLQFIKKVFEKYDQIDFLSKTLYTDLKVTLEGDMLTKVDRASMLCSLETRVPFLHKDVIELAARIPMKFKISANRTKIIVRDSFSDLIPVKLLHASKKGFGFPIGMLLREELSTELNRLLSMELIRNQGIFDYDYIQTILKEHMTQTKDRSSELWTLFVFNRWYEEYML